MDEAASKYMKSIKPRRTRCFGSKSWQLEVKSEKEKRRKQTQNFRNGLPILRERNEIYTKWKSEKDVLIVFKE
jgi:hypothetical protein